MHIFDIKPMGSCIRGSLLINFFCFHIVTCHFLFRMFRPMQIFSMFILYVVSLQSSQKRERDYLSSLVTREDVLDVDVS